MAEARGGSSTCLIDIPRMHLKGDVAQSFTAEAIEERLNIPYRDCQSAFGW